MKYITAIHKHTRHFIPIVFADEFAHSDVANLPLFKDCEIRGAGFVDLDQLDGNYDKIAFGKSESMGIGPGKDDCWILYSFLHEGLSGLALDNHLTMLDILEMRGGAK